MTINEFAPDRLWIYHAGFVENLLGPGLRMVLWLSGCDFRCPGCIDPAQWRQESGKEIDVSELRLIYNEARDNIAGITFSGGEPLRQSHSLLSFLKCLPPQLDKMLFTGYTSNELSPEQRQARSYMDISVEGRFVEKLAGDFLWRGSSNKVICSPTGKYDAATLAKWMNAPSAGVSVCVLGDKLFTYGVPKKGALHSVETQLAQKGIQIYSIKPES